VEERETFDEGNLDPVSDIEEDDRIRVVVPSQPTIVMHSEIAL
jgi:hypothetical protein